MLRLYPVLKNLFCAKKLRKEKLQVKELLSKKN